MILDDKHCKIILNNIALLKRARSFVSRDSLIKMYNALVWPHFNDREIIMAFKILSGRSPQYLEKLFSVSQNDNYNLRSNQTKLKLPKPKTNFLKRSFHTGLRNPGT